MATMRIQCFQDDKRRTKERFYSWSPLDSQAATQMPWMTGSAHEVAPATIIEKVNPVCQYELHGEYIYG